MIRAIPFYPQMNNSGTERVIFNLYENIDRIKVQLDFSVEHPVELDEKARAMGGGVHSNNERNDLSKAYWVWADFVCQSITN